MHPQLLDTPLYIQALRQGDRAVVDLRRRAPDAPLWLSAVVLEELYAGAVGKELRVVERLEKQFTKVGRVLTPSLADWVQAGRLLSRLAQKYGYEEIGRARRTNDVLIAVIAARLGITVLTANERDFARVAEFRPVRWEAVSL